MGSLLHEQSKSQWLDALQRRMGVETRLQRLRERLAGAEFLSFALGGSEGADATSPQLTHLQSYPQPVEKPVDKFQVPYKYLFIGTSSAV